ncbi:hypothetical protein [Lutibacter citreus]|uniref:hypothetical protein n=1 Tax=Lutibacter citreus TaxID=2138210 RepID=UPI000DBE6101|nr:hypothetical protein [Lutibacter citreus]
MSQFQYSFYHIINQKIENKFEPLFKEFKHQIYIYERQFKLTSKAYVSEWNEELKTNDKNYKLQKTKAEVIYKNEIKDYGEDEYAHSYAMNASGLKMLDHQHYSQKEEIDIEYNSFLDLYSKSILIALYSLNESKLNEIVNVASTVFNKKIKPSHFNSRDYLNSSIQYLNLVIEIETGNLETHISKLKDIQFLRNGIVHNSSIFSEIKTAINIVKKYNKSLRFNKSDNSINIINSAFINDFFQLLKDFYEELFWTLDIKQESIIIKNGLSHWLGVLDKDIIIDTFKLDKNTKNEKLISFSATLKDQNIKGINGKITLKKSSQDSFDFTNQTGNKTIDDFLEYEKKLEGNYMMDIFKPFNINHSNYEKKILVH